MKRRIARELNDENIIAQISEAIASAIEHYERRRFFFNEGRVTATSVADQMTYALPDDIIEADHLQVTVAGTQWELERVPYAYFVERDQATPVTGQPSYWAIYEYCLFIWPVPTESTYTFTLSYLKKLTTIVNSDSNAWTTEAERLIRARAKWSLATDSMSIPNAAQMFKAIELEALRELKRETSRLAMSGRIVPHYL